MADKKISQLTAATTPLAGTEVLPIVQGGSTVKVSVANLTAGRPISTTLTTIENAGTIEQNGPAGGLYFRNTTVSGGATNQRFYTTNASGVAQLQLQLNGGTTPVNSLYGDVKAETGNFVVGTSGKGIDFSATPDATATSELLADYEEGTWTPVVADALSGGNLASIGTAVGRYTKIGRIVTVQLSLDNITTTGMTAGNQIYIRGLPYANASGLTVDGSCSTNRITYAQSGWRPHIDPSASVMQFVDPTSATANYTTMIVSNIVSSGVSDIYATITYTV